MSEDATSTSALLEARKSVLSAEAKEAAAAGRYLEAARLKQAIAAICDSQGKVRDAHLLEVGAHHLLIDHYDARHQPALDGFVDLLRRAQGFSRREGPLYWKEPMMVSYEASAARRAIESIDDDLVAIHQERLSTAADEAEARQDDHVAAVLKEILAQLCQARGKDRDAYLLTLDAERLAGAEQRRRRLAGSR